MKTRMFLILGLLLMPFCAQAATANDVSRVIGCMKTHTCKHLMASKSYASPLSGEQIVFVQGGKRYTLYWTGDYDNINNRPSLPTDQFLSVWVRPDGTQNTKAVDGFSDNGVDGSVNFGFKGDSPNPSGKFFEDGTDGSEAKGTEFRDYWQDRYDQAITAAVQRLL
jgi:hypothetical protein